MQLQIEAPTRPLFDPRVCQKPRRHYKITPRSKHPPGWQNARRFVKSLVVAQIGAQPYPSLGGWGPVMRYNRAYKALRDAYNVEDFPINP